MVHPGLWGLDLQDEKEKTRGRIEKKPLIGPRPSEGLRLRKALWLVLVYWFTLPYCGEVRSEK